MTSDDRALDARYLDWLFKQITEEIDQNRNSPRSYWLLAVELFQKEFDWFVPNDDNRVEDGRILREEFFDETAAGSDREWLEQGCSMLEMLVALSRRCAFETGEEPLNWFWVLMANIGLDAFDDNRFDHDFKLDIDVILDRIIHRTYGADGRGGLFPLSNPTRDQREVEIWYQMASYILEHDS
jgi:hypothetical protein